jgi:hypothetical protein
MVGVDGRRNFFDIFDKLRLLFAFCSAAVWKKKLSRLLNFLRKFVSNFLFCHAKYENFSLAEEFGQ